MWYPIYTVWGVTPCSVNDARANKQLRPPTCSKHKLTWESWEIKYSCAKLAGTFVWVTWQVERGPATSAHSNNNTEDNQALNNKPAVELLLGWYQRLGDLACSSQGCVFELINTRTWRDRCYALGVCVCAWVTHGATNRMGLWPLSPGQTDKMTVADTVTVTSGRGQLWREICDLV